MMSDPFAMFTPNLSDMRQQMVHMGFAELRTQEEVDAALASKGTSMVFVNSTCGCAGGIARPAAHMALAAASKPDHMFTVFAGQDKEATARARELWAPLPPSSPSVAFMRDGKLVHMIPRSEIEGHDPREVAQAIARTLQELSAQ